MTKTLFTVTTLTLLLFSGCAQNASDGLVPGGTNMSGTDTIHGNGALGGNTISISDNTYGNENSEGLNTDGYYNSSSDGFKSVYFAFGKYAITPDMEARIRHNLNTAKGTNSKIKLEGNCDEFGTDEYNYALGLKRAKAVKDTLVAQGVASSKMIMVSFGESSPVCQSASESCYKRNRRVDLQLVR